MIITARQQQDMMHSAKHSKTYVVGTVADGNQKRSSIYSAKRAQPMQEAKSQQRQQHQQHQRHTVVLHHTAQACFASGILASHVSSDQAAPEVAATLYL